MKKRRWPSNFNPPAYEEYRDGEDERPTEKYPTIQLAMAAVRRLKINTVGQYRKKYWLDPRLRANPAEAWSDDWMRIGRWRGFLGKPVRRIYPTLAEAQIAARRLKIRTRDEYLLRHDEDPRLPGLPPQYYPDWAGWRSFLQRYYATIEEAAAAVQQLNIKTLREFKRRYREDPMIPPVPKRQYAKDWAAFGKWKALLRGNHG